MSVFPDVNNDMIWRDMEPSVTNQMGSAIDNSLGRDAFLRLLVAQLQHQDPFNPMSDTEFVSQLAQFSSLEQMQQMNESTTRAQAFSIVGRDVRVETRSEEIGQTERLIGVVSSVVARGSETYIVVDGPHGRRTVPMADVRQVGPEASIDLLTAINHTLLTAQNTDLIGQWAQFKERDEEGDITRFIEGRIDAVRFDNERGLLLQVGSEEVTASQILAISNGPLLINRQISGPGGVSGPIESVSVLHGNLTLRVSGDTGGQIVINDPTHTTNALRHVGIVVNHQTAGAPITGTVVGVEIIGGDPRLVLHTGDRICFLDFSGVRRAEENESETDENQGID